jgi:hypothetical protein
MKTRSIIFAALATAALSAPAAQAMIPSDEAAGGKAVPTHTAGKLQHTTVVCSPRTYWLPASCTEKASGAAATHTAGKLQHTAVVCTSRIYWLPAGCR